MLHAGTAANVIPDEAELAGTLRSFSDEVRETLRRRLREVLDGVHRRGRLHGPASSCCPVIPAVVNDPDAVERVRAALPPRWSGRTTWSNPHRWPPRRTFAYFLRRATGGVRVRRGRQRGKGDHGAASFAGVRHRRGRLCPAGAELLARLALEP